MEMDNYTEIMNKLAEIQDDLKRIKKHQEDNSFEKMVLKQWGSFYSLSLLADTVLKQNKPPSEFL